MASVAESSRRTTSDEKAQFGGRAPGRQTGVRHILVCLDRTPSSELCLPHAVALARLFDARLTLLHVMQHHPRVTELSAPDPLGWEIARQEAQEYLDGLRDRMTALPLPIRTIVAQGEAAGRIVAVAAEIGADLTVIARHGERGTVTGRLGGTVQQVLAISHGSVYLAQASGKEVAPKRILVALDGSPRTECVLPSAVRIARACGAELLIVHVVAEPVPSTILSAAEDIELARDLARRLEAEAARYLERLARQLSSEGVTLRTIVLRETDSRQALLAVSEREHVDLIIVSAHGSTCNAARPFGTVASYLLNHARPALLVIQDLQATEHEAAGDELDDRRAAPLRGTAHTGPPEAT